MKTNVGVKFVALFALLFTGLMSAPASATISTGGIFDKIDGAYYAKNKSHRRARKNYSSHKYGSRKYRARKRVLKKVRRNYASRGYYKVGRRPGKWCGWWMRTQKGGGPAFNVAWNWRHYGRPTSPQIGAVVVWRHHVGMIVGRTAKGQWIVKSGNDGGRVRTRARSVRGAIFRI